MNDSKKTPVPRAAIAIVGFLCSLVLAPWAVAGEVYSAQLNAVDGTESTATGTALFDYDASRGELIYTIEFEGLSSDEIGAHIHRGDGTIVHALPLGSPKDGIWRNIGPVAAFQLTSGQLFVLIHSQDNPGGEIRGDIELGIVSTESPSVGELKRGFGAREDG